MNSRHVFICIFGFVVGIAALPFATAIASAIGHPQAGVQTTRMVHGMATRMGVPSARLAYRHLGAAMSAGPHPFGTTPATIIAIRDNKCKFFVTTSPVDLSTVKKDDPRLQPCTPTASNFQVEWSGPPTAAQNHALLQVLGDLAQNHPTIALSMADPIIRAAVQNAHAVPVISSTLAQPPKAATHADGAAQTGTNLRPADAVSPPHVSTYTPVSAPSWLYGTTPAQFLGIRDNQCRFYVTTSQADANTWTGPNDPRSRPCEPTANSFSPIWSGKPTRAQWDAWGREMSIFANRYPTITLQQAQPLVQAALAKV